MGRDSRVFRARRALMTQLQRQPAGQNGAWGTGIVVEVFASHLAVYSTAPMAGMQVGVSGVEENGERER